MTQVGIFGDTLVPQGPEAAEEIVAEALAAAEVEESIEPRGEVEETETTEEATSDVPEGFSSVVTDPAADQAVAIAEADAEAEESEEADAEEEAEAPKTAAEVIEEIEAADSVEAVDALAEGDERKTVIAAAAKRKDELSD
jgi:hypothetical protein